MARIFPNNPIGALTPEAARVYRLLKRLPDSDYVVWQRLDSGNRSGPDFWVLHRDRRTLLITVSTATEADALRTRQADMFQSLAGSSSPLGQDELSALETFRAQLAAEEAAEGRLAFVVLFPNVAEAHLQYAIAGSLPDSVTWAGREALAADRFSGWVEQHLGSPMSPASIDLLRRAFTPEVVVPRDLTVRTPIDRNTDAKLTDYILDYDQEWALKVDLELSEEAQAQAREFGVRLVNGVAGSGKSLILLYRAHLLRQFYPDKKILVLTHNKPLIRDLSARYRRLAGQDAPIEWRTFLGWCFAYWPKQTEKWPQPLSNSQRMKLITRAWHAHLADTTISERSLADEIDWYKDRLLFTREAYLRADRSGRGFGLTEGMRHRVYNAIEAYQASLDVEGLVDWADVPRNLYRLASAAEAELPIYDFILIDEAQFFAPLWFELIKRALKPRTGHLFMVADPTQGFLKRGQSWLSSGLDIRGRALRLARSYRTTREILNFATLFYRARVPNESEDIVVPQLQRMIAGQMPQIITVSSGQDELTRVVNEIRSLLGSGVPPGHILVLHADWQGAERALARLRVEFGQKAVEDPHDTARRDCLRVCSLGAATGLESPIVFLLGVHELFETEQSVTLSAEERSEVVRDNARKLYMAMTRAGQRLVMTYIGDVPEPLRSYRGPVQPATASRAP